MNRRSSGGSRKLFKVMGRGGGRTNVLSDKKKGNLSGKIQCENEAMQTIIKHSVKQCPFH
jgi:hypothetical protein